MDVSESPSYRKQNKEPSFLVGTVCCLISLGIAAITSSVILFGVSLALIVHSKEDTPAARVKAHMATHSLSAPIAPLHVVAPLPTPANATPYETIQIRPAAAPHDTTPASIAPRVAPPKTTPIGPPLFSTSPEATPTLPVPAKPSQKLMPRSTAPNSPSHGAIPNHLASASQLFAIMTQKAQEKGIAYEQYRDARMRFLQKQQAAIELQLTEPSLSVAQKSRLERQKVYWGRAVEQMLTLP